LEKIPSLAGGKFKLKPFNMDPLETRLSSPSLQIFIVERFGKESILTFAIVNAEEYSAHKSLKGEPSGIND
jgi:hypothetical protein